MAKIQANAEISDLSIALGVGLGKRFELEDLRYERVVIMTDADVDGAHIAALLITFFYRYTPGLIESGRLYMACLLYTSPSPRDATLSRMPSSA